MSIVDLAVSQAYTMLRERYRDCDAGEIKRDIKAMIEESIVDIPSKISNSIKEYYNDVGLLSVLDSLSKTKHCIAGNGCVYENHDDEDAPRTKWLNSKLINRKVFKKKQFEAPYGSDEYNFYKLSQELEKRLANSEYGAVGSKTSALYFAEGGSSTTLSGRIVISSAACLFEQILCGGNYMFSSFADLLHFLSVCENDVQEGYDLKIHHTTQQFISHLQSRCDFEFNPFQQKILEDLIDGMNEYARRVIFYKWNLYDFLEEEIVRNMLGGIISKKITLLNPYEIPSEIQEEVDTLGKMIFDCVYQRGYSPHDRIVKFASMKRGVVIGADTDSNMIYTKPTSDRIFKICAHTPNSSDYITFTNLQASFLSPILKDLFKSLSKSMNVPDRYLGQFAMKNEFLWTRIVLTLVKKRYVAKTIVQEGHLLDPPRVSITGHDFYKSGCPTKAFNVFKTIIDECFLKDGELDLFGTITRLEQLEKDIKQSLLDGSIEFLPRVSIRAPGALKFPWRHQGYRGTYFWNMLNPQHAGGYIGKGAVLYLTLSSPSDIPNNHYMYDSLMRNVFNNSYIPDSEANAKRLTMICIPDTYGKIPKWCFEFIDFHRIIDGITSFFASAIEPFGIVFQRHGTPKTHYTHAPSRFIQF